MEADGLSPLSQRTWKLLILTPLGDKIMSIVYETFLCETLDLYWTMSMGTDHANKKINLDLKT